MPMWLILTIAYLATVLLVLPKMGREVMKRFQTWMDFPPIVQALFFAAIWPLTAAVAAVVWTTPRVAPGINKYVLGTDDPYQTAASRERDDVDYI